MVRSEANPARRRRLLVAALCVCALGVLTALPVAQAGAAKQKTEVIFAGSNWRARWR